MPAIDFLNECSRSSQIEKLGTEPHSPGWAPPPLSFPLLLSFFRKGSFWTRLSIWPFPSSTGISQPARSPELKNHFAGRLLDAADKWCWPDQGWLFPSVPASGGGGLLWQLHQNTQVHDPFGSPRAPGEASFVRPPMADGSLLASLICVSSTEMFTWQSKGEGKLREEGMNSESPGCIGLCPVYMGMWSGACMERSIHSFTFAFILPVMNGWMDVVHTVSLPLLCLTLSHAIDNYDGQCLLNPYVCQRLC